ncbi:mucoidy inhibitor MuiA family protein [Flavobacterium okayamense]|uniref:Membrane protein n=1 Tax=Flavobacterium okayamense TaxID=2830782 RepID=A0ABM7S4P3_9FLAO|nr:mucoidy inhibitor MuiA family protein [Flavobacterium okayamense]BCY28462.1 membrane protein [Flavobacterium okayamense]
MNILKFLPIFIFSISIAQIKTKTVESKIEKIIVFTEGAQVSRKATANFEKGKTELVFQGISPFLDKESLKVKGKGDFTILSVINQSNFLLSQEKRDEVQKIEKKKRDFLAQKSLENNVLKILNNEETILSKNQEIGGNNNGLKTVDLKDAVNFHRERLISLVKERTIAEDKIVKIDSVINTLDLQLKALNNSLENATSEIIVTISSSKFISNAEFNIDYYVSKAGWFANYDLRVKDINSPVDLQFRANVFQQTGENWKDVAMSISNGNPTENSIAPELSPWYLKYGYQALATNNYYNQESGIKTYGPLVGNKVTGIVSDELGPIAGANVVVKGTTIGTTTDFDGQYSLSVPKNAILEISYVGSKKEVYVNSNRIDVVLESAKLEEVVVVAYSAKRKKRNKGEGDSIELETEINYQPTTVTYDIKNPFTVMSDGKIYTAEIINYEIPATYEYLSVPKIDPSAYLTAKITDWQELNLSSGEMNLYFEDAYLGKSLLDLNSATDTLSVSLGKDKGIYVGRKKLKEFSSKKFLSNAKREARAFETIVKNNKPYPIEIKILDQLPISTNKEIVIEDEEYSGGKLEEKTKIITWDLKLDSKESRNLQTKYIVKYPKGKYIHLE